ncbi:four-carbon acid sugar kinase family protein [Clostridium sp. HBUAS56010]|uniref:four-carbon acid sugar kinase family protein n=1 Tax=Clostridium sp. HBUAS56010 TaxID=2571127 RepID=UPI001177DDBE|nr:four-carbon acid sugar kinase family protein [Clostridium sp. HBUAS56010]
MLKTVIIADDLTGANDTGAIIAKDGFQVGTILDLKNLENFKDFDVLCISTDSRGLSKEEAYKEVALAASYFKDKENIFFSKRCDSTLRGNVGAEIDSILDALGQDTTAIVVASFPSSGRTCIGDHLLVHQIPLEKTEVAKDPISPVTLSRVTEIVKKQSGYPVGYLPLSQVLKGWEAISSSLKELSKTNRILVVDARTNDDISAIAAGCIASGLKIVAIDPGSFTAAMTRQLYGEKREKTSKKKILCGIGSASALTRRQVKNLKDGRNPLIVKTDASRFFYKEEREAEIQRVAAEVIRKQDTADILAVVTTMEENDVLNLSEIAKKTGKTTSECADAITYGVAEIIYTIKAQLNEEIQGIYTSGGDIAAAFCDRIGAVGFDVKDEVVPLAIYSKVLGGDFDGISMITKGGLVGDDSTLTTCLDYLMDQIKSF